MTALDRAIDRQNDINDNQAILNDHTKITLSPLNLWGIIITIVAATAFFLKIQYDTSLQIAEINNKLTYITKNLEKHLADSEQGKKDMLAISKNRDSNFAVIKSNFTTIATALKINLQDYER